MNEKQRKKPSRFYLFLKKIHFFYLLAILFLYGFMHLLYTLTSTFTKDFHFIHMKIDSGIPFISYFVIFYICYYFVPGIYLLVISFKNKEKFKRVALTLFIMIISCSLVYSFYNVKMVRSPLVDINMKFSDVSSFSSFFDFLVSIIYNLDPVAANCFPSLHAVWGMATIILSISSSNKSRLKWPWMILGIIIGTGIICSTFFIKQHYFIDAVIGASLTLLVYLLILGIEYLLTIKAKREIYSRFKN